MPEGIRQIFCSGTAGFDGKQFRVAQPADVTVDECDVGAVVVPPWNEVSVVHIERAGNFIIGRADDTGAGTFGDQHALRRFFYPGDFSVTGIGGAAGTAELIIQIGVQGVAGVGQILIIGSGYAGAVPPARRTAGDADDVGGGEGVQIAGGSAVDIGDQRMAVAGRVDRAEKVASVEFCNAPLFSRAALRRSSQKMQISFFENPLCRPFLFYAADA